MCCNSCVLFFCIDLRCVATWNSPQISHFIPNIWEYIHLFGEDCCVVRCLYIPICFAAVLNSVTGSPFREMKERWRHLNTTSQRQLSLRAFFHTFSYCTSHRGYPVSLDGWPQMEQLSPWFASLNVKVGLGYVNTSNYGTLLWINY